MPPSLGAAILTEPLWLQSWITLLGVTNLLAILFVVTREGGRWRLRPEPPVILASFVAAGVLMGWMYEQVGYVRLLGLAHLVFWGPVWAWILTRRRAIGTRTWFGRYIHLYLVVAGISLVIDAVDVVRHLLGDGQLLESSAALGVAALSAGRGPSSRAPSACSGGPDRRSRST